MLSNAFDRSNKSKAEIILLSIASSMQSVIRIKRKIDKTITTNDHRTKKKVIKDTGTCLGTSTGTKSGTGTETIKVTKTKTEAGKGTQTNKWTGSGAGTGKGTGKKGEYLVHKQE